MARTFKDIPATMSTTTMVDRLNNMLTKVDNMIKNNNIYSVWIRLVIGKKEQLVFDSSSTNPDENLFMGLDYQKSGMGQANEFTFKVAFDLFNFGQVSQGHVEKLDELIYKALNIQSYENAEDYFYCKFQYGYNVTGDTQIVSPLYEGIITDIIPSVDYTNGKTYYTIKGTSFIMNSHLKYDFTPVEGWNAFDLILWNLWYYHGNNDTVNELYDKSYATSHLESHSDDWKNGIADKYNIDIPIEIKESASNINMEHQEDMTVFDYIDLVLSETVNTKDERYDSDTGDYKVEDGDFKPYYIYYITDSGGGGVPTIHFTFVSSRDSITSMKGISTINFDFEWFNKTNNIVIGWNPQVDLKAYFLTRAQKEHYKLKIDKNNNEIKDNLRIMETGFNSGPGSINDKLENRNEELKEENKEMLNRLTELAKGYEFYKSTITLIGIPADIPLNIVLSIKPKILESISRTQGQYYVLGSTDKINTNGLYTTTINLFRLKDLPSASSNLVNINAILPTVKIENPTPEQVTAADDFRRRDKLLNDNGIYLG